MLLLHPHICMFEGLLSRLLLTIRALLKVERELNKDLDSTRTGDPIITSVCNNSRKKANWDTLYTKSVGAEGQKVAWAHFEKVFSEGES